MDIRHTDHGAGHPVVLMERYEASRCAVQQGQGLIKLPHVTAQGRFQEIDRRRNFWVHSSVLQGCTGVCKSPESRRKLRKNSESVTFDSPGISLEIREGIDPTADPPIDAFNQRMGYPR
jgi:hypothetical protein